jgi:hypothetical protein
MSLFPLHSPVLLYATAPSPTLLHTRRFWAIRLPSVAALTTLPAARQLFAVNRQIRNETNGIWRRIHARLDVSRKCMLRW